MTGRRLAPAKVNLFLHVGPTGSDGYHPLATWMVFADVGDTLSLSPAPHWRFEVSGPFAADIGGGENLAERAALRLCQHAGVSAAFELALDKRLPVAAGLGGGSSDAGAALRLVNEALPKPQPEAVLVEIAGELGADGPACLLAAPVLAFGRGDRLEPGPATPPLPAVLVNPRRPAPTGAVYRAYDEGPGHSDDRPELPAHFEGPREVAATLALLRNDLQVPAIGLEPQIGAVLAWLNAQPETLLARMSGSGATSFALCATQDDAATLAGRIGAERPDWWAVDCRLM